MIPVTILSTLVPSVAASPWRAQMRTYRAEVHKEGEDDSPEVPGVNNVATIELGRELALDSRMSGRRFKQRTDQKTIG